MRASSAPAPVATCVARVLAAVLVLAAALVPATAHGQAACQPPDRMSTCFPADNVWAADGAGPWLTLAPVSGPRSGALRAGLVTSYLHRPIGLRVSSPDPDGTVIHAVENLVTATALVSYGVSPRVRVGMALPVVVFQRGAGKADVIGSDETLPGTVLGDVRFGAAAVIVHRPPEQDGPELGAAFELALPTGDDAAFTSAPSATYAPSLVFGYRLGALLLGVQGGGRLRAHSQLATTKVGPQLSAAVGASYDIVGGGWLSAGAEAFALFTLVNQLDAGGEPEPAHIPAEWSLSLRTAALDEGRLGFRVAGGSFIPTAETTAATTPAFRFVAGVGYTFE